MCWNRKLKDVTEGGLTWRAVWSVVGADFVWHGEVKPLLAVKTQTQDYVVRKVTHDFCVCMCFPQPGKTCRLSRAWLASYTDTCHSDRLSALAHKSQVAKRRNNLNCAYCFVWVRNLVCCFREEHRLRKIEKKVRRGMFVAMWVPLCGRKLRQDRDKYTVTWSIICNVGQEESGW